MRDRRARRRLGAAAALALGVAVAPGAAHAQFFGGWGGWDNGGAWDGLAPGQVRRSIAQQGFRVLAPLRRNGNVYVADVADGRGRHERLIVAAADAQILQRFIVDDGRGFAARDGDGGRAFAGRSGDDERPLVPPADIPEPGRRFARPADGDAPSQRFGDLGAGGGEDAPATGAEPLRRPQPPVRVVRPRPRIVERAPEGEGARTPGAVESTPLEPAAPRAAPVPAAPAPASPPPVAAAPRTVPVATPRVASRPEPAAAPAAVAPAQAAPSVAAGSPPSADAPPAAGAPPAATATRRMSDPLAIPGGDAGGRPVRNVASGITGAPALAPAKPAAASPAKPGDVPVAPLD